MFYLLDRVPDDKNTEAYSASLWDEKVEAENYFLNLLTATTTAISSLERKNTPKTIPKTTPKSSRSNSPESSRSSSPERVEAVTRHVGLPKFVLQPFDGDILKWQSWWESYESVVHNQKIPDVDKFNYLKMYLRGEAEKAMGGLSLMRPSNPSNPKQS